MGACMRKEKKAGCVVAGHEALSQALLACCGVWVAGDRPFLGQICGLLLGPANGLKIWALGPTKITTKSKIKNKKKIKLSMKIKIKMTIKKIKK